MMRLLHSLSFRLAMLYVGLFCSSMAVLLGLYYWLNVHAPLDVARQQVATDARAMAQIYILDGGKVLTRRLEMRAASLSHRKAFHAFIDRDGKVVTSNLPSWPKTVAAGWRRFEADVYRDGEENDHEALVLDRKFDDGALRNTTIAVVATSALLTRVALSQLARASSAALFRRITPTGTSFDGDIVFAVCPTEGAPAPAPQVEGVAVAALEEAVERAVRLAVGRDGIPGLADTGAAR